MTTLGQISEIQQQMGQCLQQATSKIATHPFGKNEPKDFMVAMADFLKSSTPEARSNDEAYAQRIYAAITTLQMNVLFGEPLEPAKIALRNLLYDPSRRFVAPGMQTANMFVDAVVSITQEEKRAVFGQSPQR